jgi:hypothetical protein
MIHRGRSFLCMITKLKQPENLSLPYLPKIEKAPDGSLFSITSSDRSNRKRGTTSAGRRSIGIIEYKSSGIQSSSPIDLHAMQIQGMSRIDDAGNAFDIHPLVFWFRFFEIHHISESGTSAPLYPYAESVAGGDIVFRKYPLQFFNGRIGQFYRGVRCCHDRRY